MYMDKEGRFNLIHGHMKDALAENVLYDDEDKKQFTRLAVGDITRDQLMAEFKVKGDKVQATIEQAATSFFEECSLGKKLRLIDLDGDQVPALRHTIQTIAALLRFNWDGVFQKRVMNGCLGELAMWSFGEEPCPDTLILHFQSSLVAGSSGERTIIVYDVEKVYAIFDEIVDKLISPKRPPTTFAELDEEKEKKEQKRAQLILL